MIRQETKRLFDENGICIPFPQVVLHDGTERRQVDEKYVRFYQEQERAGTVTDEIGPAENAGEMKAEEAQKTKD